MSLLPSRRHRARSLAQRVGGRQSDASWSIGNMKLWNSGTAIMYPLRVEWGDSPQSRIPQKLRRLFRWCGVNVEPAAPFESRHLRQARHDLDVPVVVWHGRFLGRRSVDQEIVRRFLECLV